MLRCVLFSGLLTFRSSALSQHALGHIGIVADDAVDAEGIEAADLFLLVDRKGVDLEAVVLHVLDQLGGQIAAQRVVTWHAEAVAVFAGVDDPALAEQAVLQLRRNLHHLDDRIVVETGDDEIFIYGGEPTIHPEFEQILKLSEKYYQTYS